MSVETMFTFLSKVFARISIAFSLFFVVLAAGYYFGIISETIFSILFILLLILLFVDTVLKFLLKQDETLHLHKLEKNYVADNYEAYRATLQKDKKEDTINDFIKGLGLESALKLISAAKNVTLTSKKKEKEKEKKLDLIQAEIDLLNTTQE